MGRITSYTKMKIGLILFIFFIFLVSFFLILVSSATEIKKQKNEENEINFLLNASRSEAIKQIASFEKGKITEEELYKNLITSSIKENYIAAYLLAEKEHLDISLFVGTKSKIYVDSNLLFMVPIYENDTYIGYLNYLDFFSMKELSAIYALNNSIEHHFTIKGIILEDGYIGLNYFDAYKISQRIIENEAGEKVVEEFKDVLLSYTLDEAKNDIEISIDAIDTPLRNIILDGKKIASKTSGYLKKEYEYWKNYPYDIIMHMDKDNTNSILDWSYLFYETTKTMDGFAGFGKMAYPFKEAFYHNWILLLILSLLLPIVIFILCRLILKLEQTV
ncbi:MAG: hypothetical protein K2N42_04005, partial [Anaeroplasmataceae bacterium]|nr:hypothetical protein [Anaeroplasmataceae bacterium]